MLQVREMQHLLFGVMSEVMKQVGGPTVRYHDAICNEQLVIFSDIFH